MTQGAAAARGATDRAGVGVWSVVLGLAAVAFWTQWRAAPGVWGADALSYAETIVRGDYPNADHRSHRVLILHLVDWALRLGDWSPQWAALPGALFSAATIPALWIALRRVVGDAAAVVAAAAWTFFRAGIGEVTRISTDGAISLPVALACAAVLAAARDPTRATRRLIVAGLLLGIGTAAKETLAFGVVGFVAAAFCVGRGRARWTNAAALGATALAVAAVATFATSPARFESIRGDAASFPFEDSWGRPSFFHRLFFGVPTLFLTSRADFGLFGIVMLPLAARLPFRALRGEPLAVAAVVGVGAISVLPVSVSNWALLPASARFFVWFMPLFAVALAQACVDAPTSRIERAASLVAAVAGLAFIGRDPWTWWIPAGLLAAAWPALPRTWTDRPGAAALAPAALLATATLALAVGAAPVAPWRASSWAVALAVTAVLVVAASACRLRRAAPVMAVCAVGYFLALGVSLAVHVPDPMWSLWDHVPRSGTLHCDDWIARCSRFSALHAGVDPSHVVDVGAAQDAVPVLECADDRIAAFRGSPLDRRCRSQTSPPLRVDAEFGNIVTFAPAGN